MFEHVTILLSIIFALAMTHILASATELVWERPRVCFYGLHALWMVNALLSLLCYWLSIWALAAVKHWTGLEIVLQFLTAIVQYFACSLLSMRREGSEVMDMKAFYERQRPAIFAAFSLTMIISMAQNFVDRNNPGAEIPLFLMLVVTLIAGWAKPCWLQWIAGLFIFALEVLFITTYVASAA